MIYVIEDDESVRVALLRLLDAAGLAALGYVSGGDFLLHRVADEPSCILADINLPGPSGLEIQAALERRDGSLPMVFLTGTGDASSATQAMKAGAVDFLQKPVQSGALLDALGRAIGIDGKSRAERTEYRRVLAMAARLTERERAIFDGVVKGSMAKQIGVQLRLSERSIKGGRAAMMSKLGMTSSAEMGGFAEKLKRAIAWQAEREALA